MGFIQNKRKRNLQGSAYMASPNFLSLLRVNPTTVPIINEKNELTGLFEGPDSVNFWTIHEGMMRLLFNLFP